MSQNGYASSAVGIIGFNGANFSYCGKAPMQYNDVLIKRDALASI